MRSTFMIGFGRKNKVRLTRDTCEKANIAMSDQRGIAIKPLSPGVNADAHSRTRRNNHERHVST
jgi:hypothetical protein